MAVKVFVAMLQRGVLRGAKARPVGEAVRPAGLVAIDRQRNAALVGGDDFFAGAAAFPIAAA